MSYHFANITLPSGDFAAPSADALLEMHRGGWPGRQVDRREAEDIFALHRTTPKPTTEWCTFFITTISDWVLNGSEPHGYVSDLDALWLIAQLEHGGHEACEVETELLLRVIETARNDAHALKALVLEGVERVVFSKTPPCVGEAECETIRRTVFSRGRDGYPGSVSRREAELLFRIKDACVGAENAQEWRYLFVHAVGRFLAGFASAPEHRAAEPMFELDCFIAENRASLGRFMGGMAQAAPNAFETVFRHRAPREQAQFAPHRPAAISEWKQGWLEAQINANGETDAYDRELMAFIAEEMGFS